LKGCLTAGSFTGSAVFFCSAPTRSGQVPAGHADNVDNFLLNAVPGTSMSEALILMLLVSITINVIAIWKMSSAAARATAHSVQVRELRKAIQNQNSQMDRLKEYAENMHFHHDVMLRAVRFHLHAAGLVYEPRLWHSYDAIVKAEWPFDQKIWPYHLPMLDNPASRMDAPEDLRAYQKWCEETGQGHYREQVLEVVDRSYIQELDTLCAEYLEEPKSKKVPGTT